MVSNRDQEMIDLGFQQGLSLLEYWSEQGKSVEWILEHGNNILNDK